MRVIPLPKDVVGESMLLFWRGTPELQARFPETEGGVASFCAYVQEIVRQKIATEGR